MTQIDIGQMTTTVQIEPEAIVPATPAPAAQVAASDLTMLKDLLRPLVLDILGDEIGLAARIGG